MIFLIRVKRWILLGLSSFLGMIWILFVLHTICIQSINTLTAVILFSLLFPFWRLACSSKRVKVFTQKQFLILIQNLCSFQPIKVGLNVVRTLTIFKVTSLRKTEARQAYRFVMTWRRVNDGCLMITSNGCETECQVLVVHTWRDECVCVVLVHTWRDECVCGVLVVHTWRDECVCGVLVVHTWRDECVCVVLVHTWRDECVCGVLVVHTWRDECVCVVSW